MQGEAWSDKERCLLISYLEDDLSIARIVELMCNTRTENSIRGQIFQLQQKGLAPYTSGQYNGRSMRGYETNYDEIHQQYSYGVRFEGFRHAYINPVKTCQWIIGDTKENIMCNEETIEESSFCAIHHNICWKAPRQTRANISMKGIDYAE